MEDDTHLTGLAAKSKETWHLFDSLVRRKPNISECYYATVATCRLNCFFYSFNCYYSAVSRLQKHLRAKVGGVEDEIDDDVEDEEEKRALWGRRKEVYYNADNNDYEVRFILKRQHSFSPSCV